MIATIKSEMIITDKKSYNTRQKDRLLSFFIENPTGCFSARELIDSELGIGEATIYRLLTKLTEEESIKRFVSDSGDGARYQLNAGTGCGSHFHLKCTSCGRLFHADCDFLARLEEHILSDHNFQVDNSKTILYGVCEKCGAKKQ